MNNIKISIIVAAYNVAEWLPRCIYSVIAQTHINWELILIDDGSEDETGKIADFFSKQDSRIIVIHQKNRGLVSVREKGISIAKGEYVGFIDGDDAVDSIMYEKLLYNAIVYDADISHCGLRVCYNGQQDKGDNGTDKIVVQNRNEAVRDLLAGDWMTPSLCNKLYKRDLLKDSCLDKNIINNEDLLRNFVLFRRANNIVYEDFQGYQYWSRENSLSNDEKRICRMKDVLNARKCILQNSDSIFRNYAMKSWLSAVVNTFNCMVFYENQESKILCRECRQILKQKKDYLGLLIKRQQVAAWLIIISPKLHKWVYRLYRER